MTWLYVLQCFNQNIFLERLSWIHISFWWSSLPRSSLANLPAAGELGSNIGNSKPTTYQTIFVKGRETTAHDKAIYWYIYQKNDPCQIIWWRIWLVRSAKIWKAISCNRNDFLSKMPVICFVKDEKKKVEGVNFLQTFLFININGFPGGKVCAKRVYYVSSWNFQNQMNQVVINTWSKLVCPNPVMFQRQI